MDLAKASKTQKYRSTISYGKGWEWENKFFWYDNWSSVGILRNLVGPRGVIDMGIKKNATLHEVMRTHRRSCHRIELFNKIEGEIEVVNNRQLPMRTAHCGNGVKGNSKQYSIQDKHGFKYAMQALQRIGTSVCSLPMQHQSISSLHGMRCKIDCQRVIERKFGRG